MLFDLLTSIGIEVVEVVGVVSSVAVVGEVGVVGVVAVSDIFYYCCCCSWCVCFFFGDGIKIVKRNSGGWNVCLLLVLFCRS